MKAILSSVCLVAALGLCGCGGDNNASNNSPTNAASSGNPLTAPVDYLGAMDKAKQKAVKTVDLASLTQAIQMFNVSEGRYPKDLNELVQLKYIARIPAVPYGKKIVYNAANGQVSVLPQ